MGTNSSKPTTDLRNVMAFVANRPAAPAPIEPAAPAPDDTPAPEVAVPVAAEKPASAPRKPADNQRKTKGKKEQDAPGSADDYAGYTDTFLVPVRGRKPKTVYVDEETHEALAEIAKASDGVGLSDLLINIVNHHFETYGADIRGFLDSLENQKKKRLPY